MGRSLLFTKFVIYKSFIVWDIFDYRRGFEHCRSLYWQRLIFTWGLSPDVRCAVWDDLLHYLLSNGWTFHFIWNVIPWRIHIVPSREKLQQELINLIFEQSKKSPIGSIKKMKQTKIILVEKSVKHGKRNKKSQSILYNSNNSTTSDSRNPTINADLNNRNLRENIRQS